MTIAPELQSPIAGSKKFTLAMALFLPQWGIHVWPPIEVYLNIERLAPVIDRVEELLGREVKINSWYRPELYNQLHSIRGDPHSAHLEGLAVDFRVDDLSADDVRAILLPKLDEWKIRMENKPGSTWTHIDLRDPDHRGRFFKPL